MTIESVRVTVMRRDDITEGEFEELLEEFGYAIGEGDDAEEAMAGTFGLESDYLFDAEIMAVIEENL
jgi:hypothetical protein